jgi:hypothetical protein
MTPEQETKLDRALTLLDSLRFAEDVVFSESLRRNVMEDVLFADVFPVTATTSNVNQSIGDTQAFTSPKKFDLVQTITIDGTDYKIGLFNA